MSKNRNYHNYSKAYNKLAEVKPVVETEVVPEIKQAAIDVFEEPVVISTEEAVTGENAENKTVVGVVSDCEKLNVRVAPNADATPVTVVNKGAVVAVDPTLSTDEWYKVYTETGIEGYCMRKFIKVTA